MLRKKIESASNEAQSVPIKRAKQAQSNSSSEVPNHHHHKKLTSPFFTIDSKSEQFWQKLYDIELRLCAELKNIAFLSSTISAIYNPIEYASDLHCKYMKKYLTAPKSVLFIGMNPGPYGMCQTGVPFGHVPAVKNYLKLTGSVNKPNPELAQRQIQGLECDKAEQSGQRFWSLIEDICGDAEHFFRNCFVYNLCPLAFFHVSGRNITPAELETNKRKILQNICAKSLIEVIELLKPELIISIGRFAEDRVKEVLKLHEHNDEIQHKCMPHPSPRALNNTNWNEKAKKWLIDNDVMKNLLK